MLATGAKAGLDEVAERIKLLSGVSVSPTTKATGPAATSSATDWSGMRPIVGGEFRDITVTVKLRLTRLLLAPPSLTRTVIVTAALLLACGVKRKTPNRFGLL